MPNCLPDLQSLEDERHIDIDRVGIKGLTFPMSVACESGKQPTIARVTMCVACLLYTSPSPRDTR